ncbi:hypothetical protein SSMG_08270 [Streptomyces sp. AA4]|nr:hypothetical protein SSMG_08270 [Streptomyces sp. AA4]
MTALRYPSPLAPSLVIASLFPRLSACSPTAIRFALTQGYAPRDRMAIQPAHAGQGGLGRHAKRAGPRLGQAALKNAEAKPLPQTAQLRRKRNQTPPDRRVRQHRARIQHKDAPLAWLGALGQLAHVLRDVRALRGERANAEPGSPRPWLLLMTTGP